MDLDVTYTAWSGMNATTSTSQTITEPWSKFVAKFSERRRFAGKWEHPGWSGATFSASHRCDGNVTGITFLVLDFDHDFTIEQALATYGESGGCWRFLLHTTKSHTNEEHAFRVIFPLSRVVTAEEHAKLWLVASHYCGGKLDPEPKAISQFFFCPGLLSEESEFLVHERRYAVLDVEMWLFEHDHLVATGKLVVPNTAQPSTKTVEKVAPKSDPAPGTSNYTGKGILFAAFECRNWIRKELDGDKCAVTCPWESSHTPGKGSDSSTVLYYAKPGHEMGYLHCSHAHCSGRSHDDVLGLFNQDELDEARRVVGLPAFRAPRSNVVELVPPADDDWDPTDDDDPRAPPPGSALPKPEKVVRSSDHLPERKTMPQSEKIDPHKYALTDLGNAERLVRDFGRDLRYCAPKRKWYVWSGTQWKHDETGELVRLAKATARSIYAEAAEIDDDDRRKAVTKHALTSERAPRIAAMIELAQSEPGIPVLPAELDANPWLFNCDNGTIDLRTGELLGHQREDLITRIAPVEYDAEATSALWDSYLEAATNRDKELEGYIRRACGYTLQGTVTERKFFFVFGPPGGTKSTFIETIGAAFGGYHQPADAETWLIQTYTGGNRGDLVRLAGARLVTSVEVRKEARFDEALIKRITGGDDLTAAAKYESEITFRPALTLWLAANDPPTIRDDDEGMWARICRIPFTHAIPPEKQDRTMRERLREPKVLSAVLAWAVKGCLEWQQDGIGTCAAVDASVAEYRTSMDRAAGFLDNECVFAPGVRVMSTNFRKAYESWCEENSVKPLPGKEMAARLRMRGCTDEKSGGYRYWFGVRLIDELFDQRTKGGTAGTAGTAVPGNPAMSLSRGDFSGSGVPGDPGDPRGDRQSTFDFDDSYEGEERRAIQS